jgi:hypothetical protein
MSQNCERVPPYQLIVRRRSRKQFRNPIDKRKRDENRVLSIIYILFLVPYFRLQNKSD